jgi:hypothetical protein
MTTHRVYPYMDQNHNQRAQCSCGARFPDPREAREHAAEQTTDRPPLINPYADGTTGQQGDTSRDAEPWRAQRIPLVFRLVTAAGPHGITSREAEARLNLGHGTVSGALSNLHRSGTITRLRERRDRHGVYVLPEHTQDRDTVPHRSNQPRRGCTCPCPNHPTEQDTP